MEKFKVEIIPTEDGTIPPEDVIYDAAVAAGWTNDPGDGRAFLVPDKEGGVLAREVFNPIPFAPPIGWEATPPIDQLIRERVKDEMLRLKEEEEIDDIIDAEDFEMESDLPDLTMYEFVAMEEQAPPVKPVEVSERDRIRDQLDYEEKLELERRMRRKRSHEEYARRQAEYRELYGDEPSEAVKAAVKRSMDE